MEIIEVPSTLDGLKTFFSTNDFKPILCKHMSNFDHEIDKGLEEDLKSGHFVAEYSAWNFHGDVFFWNDKFYCVIMQYHSLKEVIEANSLQEIMDNASDKYGAD